jgi:hypothetical protein
VRQEIFLRRPPFFAAIGIVGSCFEEAPLLFFDLAGSVLDEG